MTISTKSEATGSDREIGLGQLDEKKTITIDEARALYDAGDFCGAEGAYRSILQADIENTGAMLGLGVVYLTVGMDDQAAVCFERLLEIESENVAALCNMGAIYWRRGELDQAEWHLQGAINLDPRHADAFNNLGVVHYAQGQAGAAEARYRRAIDLRPNDAQFHLNRGMNLLRMGDFRNGCPEYEYRWKCKGLPSYPEHEQPKWDGLVLGDRTLLVHAEQGLGDTIQFARYAFLASLTGGRVILECRKPLVRLLESMAGIHEVVAQGDPLPPFDVHAPLIGLMGMFGTTLETIPAPIPYISADPWMVSYWAGRLRSRRRSLVWPAGELFKVGIRWQGDPTSVGDRSRSFSLSFFEPLSRITGVQLVSLQKGHGVEQLKHCGFPVVDFGAEMDPAEGTMDDVAAVIANMDLVITSCTSIAHLAGALGIPTWIALQYSADWRWFTGRDDSPWYPTVRLFRQTKPGDWAGVFDRIRNELRRLVGCASEGV